MELTCTHYLTSTPNSLSQRNEDRKINPGQARYCYLEGNLGASAPGGGSLWFWLFLEVVTERSHLVQASGDPLLSAQVRRARTHNSRVGIQILHY